MSAVVEQLSSRGDRRICRLVIDEKELCRWLGSASPGDVVDYHHGFLALDTICHSGRLSEWDRAELVRVARRAYWAMEKGFVHLLQRRNGPDDFTYLAVAGRRRCQDRFRHLLDEPIGEEVSS